jgi:hypothetical protein
LASTNASPEKKPLVLSKRADLLLKVAMVVISPLLLLGLLEGVAYIWEQQQADGIYAWEMVASRRIELVQYPEPGAGYTLIKPESNYEWQGIPVEINSHGLRSPEVSYDKPADTVRILNLGDSVAMGWGVREEETYGRQLEIAFNEQLLDGERVEVINAGVPGWNPANELAYLQDVGMRYEPDVILLDMTIVNDIYGPSALEAHNSPALIEWFRANTFFWPFLSIQFRTMQARGDGRERIDVIDPPTEAASYFPLDPASERWERIWRSIEDMKALADAQDARFLLVLFPLEFQVLDEDYSTLPQELLTAKAAEAGISVLDLLPAYRQACQEKPGGPCQLEDRYLFADVWMHPSALGHELTAAEINTYLAGIQN